MLSQIKSGVFSEFCKEAPSKGVRPAAVLCLLIGEINALSILLTKRAPHLNEHAGQISFPGGKLEAIDETIVDTALRETKEEVGLSSSEVEVLGFLSPVVTLTGFHIYPVVGYLDKTPSSASQQLNRNPNEVEEIIISGENAFIEAKNFMKMLIPSHVKFIKKYLDTVPLFIKYDAESELDNMFHENLSDLRLT